MSRTALVKSIDAFSLTGNGWFERFTPGRALSDLLNKRWMEGAVPLILGIIISVLVFAFTPVGFGDVPLVMNDVAVLGMIAVGLTLVLVGGGIDLSVGSIVGFTSISLLVLNRAFDVPAPLAMIVAVLLGLVAGAINGVFVALMNMRPFITTLVTLTAYSGVTTLIQGAYNRELVAPSQEFAWQLVGKGALLGVPLAWWLFFILLAVAHFVLTRSSWGWRLTAVGSERRSARRNGVAVNKMVFSTYAISGTLAGVAGVLTTARLGRSDANVGSGWEIIVLTAVVLGGVSLQGGRGSVLRAAIGLFVVQTLLQAAITMNLPGSSYTVILAVVLLLFAIVDLKWGKYRLRGAQKLSLDPGTLKAGELIDVQKPGSVWTVNYRLSGAPAFGTGQVDGGEDVSIDRQGNAYCGDRRGWVWKFSSTEENARGEIWSRTGGGPLGHVWDKDENLIIAVSELGVCRIDPDGNSTLIANQVKRTRGSLYDDSAFKFADDLDVAPDGSIYVSDFTTRATLGGVFEQLVELRPAGRLIRIDPDGSTDVIINNYMFPNGVVTAHDGLSIMIASTTAYRVDRLWISGPKQGQFEPVMENLPGYPDNLNRATDGNYWGTFVGLRTPMTDLLVDFPGLRRRMTREMPMDNWNLPQLNVSCVFKFNDQGQVLDVFWDGALKDYPAVTSVKEANGFLYLGSINNNRIGKLKLEEHEIGPYDARFVPGTPGTKLAMEGGNVK
jgi:ribose transport system permease protein